MYVRQRIRDVHSEKRRNVNIKKVGHQAENSRDNTEKKAVLLWSLSAYK